jgi:hypothetical protein
MTGGGSGGDFCSNNAIKWPVRWRHHAMIPECYGVIIRWHHHAMMPLNPHAMTDDRWSSKVVA